MKQLIEEIQTLIGSVSYYVDLEVQKRTEESEKKTAVLEAKVANYEEQLQGKNAVIKELKELIDFMRSDRSKK